MWIGSAEWAFPYLLRRATFPPRGRTPSLPTASDEDGKGCGRQRPEAHRRRLALEVGRSRHGPAKILQAEAAGGTSSGVNEIAVHTSGGLHRASALALGPSGN